MKIGKALADKKAAQNALARLVSVRNKDFFVIKGRKPQITLAELEREIGKKMERIRDLKLRIIYTNCHTRLEDGVTLQEAIIHLGDLRSELQAYNELLAQEGADPTAYVEVRVRGGSIKEKVAQLDRKKLLQRIEAMEARKYELDALIAKANNNIDIIERIPRG